MKGKKMIVGVLVVGVLMGGGYNCYKLVQNNVSFNLVKENVVYAAEKSQDLKNDELKNKVMEEIKKYYGETVDFDKLKFITGNTTEEEKKEDIDRSIEMLKNENNFKNFTKEQKQEMLKEFEEKKNRITHGEIYMGWTYNGSMEDYPKEYEMYEVNLNDKTQAVISINCIRKQDVSTIKPENFVNIEESQKIAEDFIVKNNLMNIKDVKSKNMKLIGKYENKYHVTAKYDEMDSVMFFYEDANDLSKKVTVSVDRTLGKVSYFCIGSEAEEQAIMIKDSQK